ncbi:hypothetical protein BAMA_04825 [Bacillus manliponensis]|uniref:Uncharacterized protein n=1 Tax=Bacillus manliponensis TaxID=574376 RepID=A0A073JWF2_9BACI|nr:hypothetical protein [Bacillus manliponensis]KEK18581.1 hypothetical protein BAMA_04825 [Bacillus manliponensis]
MKMKKMAPVLFSLGLAFGVGATATMSFPTNASAEVKDKGGSPLYETSGYKNIEFSVTGGYGHLKVYIANTSKTDMKVDLVHRDTKKIYIDGVKIAPGKVLDWRSNDTISQGVRSGMYDLQLHTGTTTLEGSYAYKSSDVKW